MNHKLIAALERIVNSHAKFNNWVRPTVQDDKKVWDSQLQIAAGLVTVEPNYELPRNVINFFRAWDNWDKDGALKFLANSEVADFLKPYRPTSALKLYRGLKYEQENLKSFEKFLGTDVNNTELFNHHNNKLSSWATDIDSVKAGEFHCDDTCSFGVILEATIPPDHILIQFSLIPSDIYKKLKLRAENEVIVKPGTVKAKILSKHNKATGYYPEPKLVAALQAVAANSQR